MCGIFYSTLRNNDDPNFLAIFKEALELVAYRGKDAAAYYPFENHYFGHTRLSIIILSSNSNQPRILSQHIMLFQEEIYTNKQLVREAKTIYTNIHMLNIR